MFDSMLYAPVNSYGHVGKLLLLARLNVIIGCCGMIHVMTTVRPKLPRPRSSRAKTRDESSRKGELCNDVL